MTPAQFWAIEQQNQQNQRENMQQMTENVFAAMSQLAGAYNEQENMKATVKSGEKLLEVLGPSFGMTADKLKEFDYSNMNMREKAMFHQGWQSNFGTASQGYNFGQRLGVQQQGQRLTAAMPGRRAQTAAQAQVAAGQGRMTTLPANINPDVIP
jgi:hypothetical protein